MYGVIDIGSNTIRLMVYRVEDGAIHPVLNKKYATGLVGYINSKGRMSKEGIRKAVEILSELRAVTQQIRLREIFPFATASQRNNTNTEEVLQAIQEASGFSVRVLSGQEEATFDYYGAIQSAPPDSGLLADVGGGSTELVQFRDREVICADSIAIGSLNLYNRFVAGILPTRAEVRKMESEVAELLKKRAKSASRPPVGPLCAVGGTARAALKLYNGLTGESGGNTRYDVGFYDDYLAQITAESKKLTNRILKIAPERIHTLTPGIAVLRAVARVFSVQSVVTSPYGVREGYLYYLLRERGVLYGTDQ